LTQAIANPTPAVRWTLLLPLAASLAGCGREQVSVYPAPKDEPPPAAAQNDAQPDAQTPAPTSDAAAQPRPEVGWKLPPGWKEAGPDSISLQNFTIQGPDGHVARVSLTQLGNLSGMNATLVNMWRQQAELPALSEADALNSIQPVQFGAEQGSYFEVLGALTNEPYQILTAFIHRSDGSWFCKISGNPALVTAQKPVFLEFLKTIEIKDNAVASAPASPAATAAPAGAGWTVPGDWQTLPPGEMQVARFHVPDQNDAKAEVSVSEFPNEAGGTLANINRWRKKYVDLAPVTESDLPQLLSPLDPATPGAVLVDMKNNNKRLIGAIVPRSGSYWFYKINGDDAAVAPQKDAFIAFAKSNP
jgi:hypothetical protein